MVVCICPPYIQIKKEEEFSPMGVVRRVCAFLYSLLSASSALSALSALSVSSAPCHIWYGGQQTGGFANLLSALKSPTYQGFAGLADKADNTDNRVVKIVFLSARCPPEKGLGGQQPIWRTTIFRENLLSACCPPRAFVVRLKEFPSGMDMFFCREIGWKNII